jgi:hypothetical protein
MPGKRRLARTSNHPHTEAMSPHRFARLALCTLALACAPAVTAQSPRPSSLSRERGAVYVEDFTSERLRLRLRQPAAAYSDLSARRSLGQLVGGQSVELIAFNEKACRVRGRAAHDTIVGWVGLASLEASDPEFFNRLQQAATRQNEVEKLIARKEAAIGMTPEEVVRAMGRPDEETKNVRAQGITSRFSYVTFDRIPQRNVVRDRYGRLTQTITYIKVETGRFTVNFDNNIVSSLESTKTRPQWNTSRLVVPPIVFW